MGQNGAHRGRERRGRAHRDTKKAAHHSTLVPSNGPTSVVERISRVLVEQGNDLAIRALHRAHAAEIGAVLRGRERDVVGFAFLEDPDQAGRAERPGAGP